MSKTIAFRAPDDLVSALERECRERDRSASWLIVDLLRRDLGVPKCATERFSDMKSRKDGDASETSSTTGRITSAKSASRKLAGKRLADQPAKKLAKNWQPSDDSSIVPVSLSMNPATEATGHVKFIPCQHGRDPATCKGQACVMFRREREMFSG